MKIEWTESLGNWVAFVGDDRALARVGLGGNGYWCYWCRDIEQHFWPGDARKYVHLRPTCKTLGGVKRRAEKYITLWVIAGRPKP